MKFYEDLLAAGSGPSLLSFVEDTISDYKASAMFAEALTAYEYFKRRNTTILAYKKLLYTMSGEAVPDNFSANYKFCNAFFPIFVKQENSYLLGDGITFNDDATKDALGGDDFDTDMYTAGEYALWGGVSFLFYNLDHVEAFKATEFVPLFGEEDGALHAGIRFWQIAKDKPMRATLYEEDGYTELLFDKGKAQVIREKTTYKLTTEASEADGIQIVDGENYEGFPIVPLWANREHQSELTGLREKIDGYDLIQSGMCNTIDEASLVYWTINNAGGMDDVDLAQFVERMRTLHAVAVDDEGAKAESHTLDVPYQATQMVLADLRDSLYRDAMALDTDKISAGNVTATAINAAYENLELKCDGFEYCVTEAIKDLLALVGLDDSPTYHRRKTTNQPEVTNMVLAAGQYLDDETILKHLPFLNIDEIDEIMKRKDKEEADRFAALAQAPDDEEDEQNGGDTGQGQNAGR